MQNIKLTQRTLFSILSEAREQNLSLQAVIVFKPEAFKQEYPLEGRSYKISNQSNYFDNTKISNALWASCLDGTDPMVRLDWYIHDWPIEYGYLISKPEPIK